jgi:hypothetical protein
MGVSAATCLCPVRDKLGTRVPTALYLKPHRSRYPTCNTEKSRNGGAVNTESHPDYKALSHTWPDILWLYEQF